MHIILVSSRFFNWLFTSSSNVRLKYQCTRQFVARRVQCCGKNTYNQGSKETEGCSYPREVLKNGRGEIAQPIAEKLALKSEYPKNKSPIEYKIGIGDTVTFSRLIENNRSLLKKTNNWPKQNVERKYKLGIGDTLALTLIRTANDLNTTAPRSLDNNENSQSVIISPQKNDSTIETTRYRVRWKRSIARSWPPRSNWQKFKRTALEVRKF